MLVKLIVCQTFLSSDNASSIVCTVEHTERWSNLLPSLSLPVIKSRLPFVGDLITDKPRTIICNLNIYEPLQWQ